MPPRISREEWYANQPRGAKPKWPTTSKAAGYAYPAWVNQKTKATKLIPVLSSDTSKLDKTRKVITLPDLAHLSFATAWAINMDPYNPIQPTYRDLLVKGPDGIYRVECQMFDRPGMSCRTCNASEPQRHCVAVSWTAPDPGTGLYPQRDPQGNPLEITLDTCRDCLIDGRRCDKVGIIVDGEYANKPCLPIHRQIHSINEMLDIPDEFSVFTTSMQRALTAKPSPSSLKRKAESETQDTINHKVVKLEPPSPTLTPTPTSTTPQTSRSPTTFRFSRPVTARTHTPPTTSNLSVEARKSPSLSPPPAITNNEASEAAFNASQMGSHNIATSTIPKQVDEDPSKESIKETLRAAAIIARAFFASSVPPVSAVITERNGAGSAGTSHPMLHQPSTSASPSTASTTSTALVESTIPPLIERSAGKAQVPAPPSVVSQPTPTPQNIPQAFIVPPHVAPKPTTTTPPTTTTGISASSTLAANTVHTGESRTPSAATTSETPTPALTPAPAHMKAAVNAIAGPSTYAARTNSSLTPHVILPREDYDLTTDVVHKHASLNSKFVFPPGYPMGFQPAYDAPSHLYPHNAEPLGLTRWHPSAYQAVEPFKSALVKANRGNGHGPATSLWHAFMYTLKENSCQACTSAGIPCVYINWITPQDGQQAGGKIHPYLDACMSCKSMTATLEARIGSYPAHSVLTCTGSGKILSGPEMGKRVIFDRAMLKHIDTENFNIQQARIYTTSVMKIKDPNATHTKRGPRGSSASETKPERKSSTSSLPPPATPAPSITPTTAQAQVPAAASTPQIQTSGPVKSIDVPSTTPITAPSAPRPTLDQHLDASPSRPLPVGLSKSDIPRPALGIPNPLHGRSEPQSIPPTGHGHAAPPGSAPSARPPSATTPVSTDNTAPKPPSIPAAKSAPIPPSIPTPAPAPTPAPTSSEPIIRAAGPALSSIPGASTVAPTGALSPTLTLKNMERPSHARPASGPSGIVPSVTTASEKAIPGPINYAAPIGPHRGPVPSTSTHKSNLPSTDITIQRSTPAIAQSIPQPSTQSGSLPSSSSSNIDYRALYEAALLSNTTLLEQNSRLQAEHVAAFTALGKAQEKVTALQKLADPTKIQKLLDDKNAMEAERDLARKQISESGDLAIKKVEAERDLARKQASEFQVLADKRSKEVIAANKKAKMSDILREEGEEREKGFQGRIGYLRMELDEVKAQLEEQRKS